jgi:hypothetical protein
MGVRAVDIEVRAQDQVVHASDMNQDAGLSAPLCGGLAGSRPS